MSILLRRAANCLLVAVFATVMALGEGLHSLPGASHQHRGHCAHSHTGRPHGCHSRRDSDDESGSIPESHDHCSICHFLAQSVELSTPPLCVGSVRCVILRPMEQTTTPLPDRSGLFDARGPPLGIAITPVRTLDVV